LCGSFSLLVIEGPIRAIEQPINLARHDEVVLMQSFDLLGAQRDSSITPAEADVRVMAFCLGKLTNFLNKSNASRKLWNRTVLRVRWDRPPLRQSRSRK
jgi:hypothetical protein